MNSKFIPNIHLLRKQYRKLPNFSEIAREQEVTPGHVRRVFWGMSVSARITSAIEAKIRQQARRSRDGKRVA